MRRVVVFGIFDGVHDGHRDLFRQARQLFEVRLQTELELIVIVGRDEVAEKLKGKKPKYTEAERLEMLKKESLVDDAILGDREFSTYTVLEQCNPDVICLGYDQHELEADLKSWMAQTGKTIPIHRAKPYKENTHHSSLLA